MKEGILDCAKSAGASPLASGHRKRADTKFHLDFWISGFHLDFHLDIWSELMSGVNGAAIVLMT